MDSKPIDPDLTAVSRDDGMDEATRAAMIGVSRAFASLGRAFICLDPGFRIIHASHVVDRLLGEGAAQSIRRTPAEKVFGDGLFGPTGELRRALMAGERREGWRATVRAEGREPALVSLTAAKLEHDDTGVCDPRIAYILVLRPPEDPGEGTEGPTYFSGVIARSPAMLRILRLIENLRQSDATVLLTGESGVGKEVLARAIHQHSPRAQGPFVAVNCGAIPADLLESELFGHVRGAFTGAVKDRIGRFEAASGGTLFLDEIGDLPQPLQVKLLRTLQERTFERVGETKTQQTDARIIAATNADLRQATLSGRFRDDLYYRLRVVPIEIPPLRERREDIRPLAYHLLQRIAAQQGLVKRMSPQAMRALLTYDWPGNVRELVNALEYAVAVGRTETILPEDLPAEVGQTVPVRREASAAPPVTPPDSEREKLLAALEAHHWRREEAARELGISRSTLWRKIREYGLS